MEQRRKKYNNLILLLAAGILISFGAALVLCNSPVQTKEFSSSKLIRYGKGWEHVSENEKTIQFVDKKVSIKYFMKPDENEGNWNYREFYISNMKYYNHINAEVSYYDIEGTELARTSENWGSGRNLVSNPVGNFQSIVVRFHNQENASFTLDGMRMMDRIPNIEKKDTVFLTLILFFVYCLILWLLRKWTVPCRLLTEIVSLEADMYKWMGRDWSVKRPWMIRTVLWTAVFFMIMFIKEEVQTGSGYVIRYLELGIFLLLYFLGNFYSERKARTQEDYLEREWSAISRIWTILCLWLLLSDFVVEKKCSFVGLVLLIAAGFLIFRVYISGSVKCFLKEFVTAFGITFAVVAVLCLSPVMKGAWHATGILSVSELPEIWKGYIFQMNLMGHSEMLFLNGRRILPYNGVLRIGYTYGMAAVLPYLLIWFEMIHQGFACFLGKGKKRVLWFAGILLIFFCNMVTNTL